MLLANPRLYPIQSTSHFARLDADEGLVHHGKMITGDHFDVHATGGDPAPVNIVLARRRQQALCTRTKQRNAAWIETGFVLVAGTAMGLDQ
jgi:hypothetical protein